MLKDAEHSKGQSEKKKFKSEERVARLKAEVPVNLSNDSLNPEKQPVSHFTSKLLIQGKNEHISERWLKGEKKASTYHLTILL